MTGSEVETEAAAERLGRSLRAGDLLLLVGPLGAGKTTFARGLARGTGSEADVSSPTFQLVRLYPGRVQSRRAVPTSTLVTFVRSRIRSTPTTKA